MKVCHPFPKKSKDLTSEWQQLGFINEIVPSKQYNFKDAFQ